MKKRNFIKLIASTFVSFFFVNISSLYAKIEKKIINKSLTEQQKKIMFNESTEKPFTSGLINETREGFYHCANCNAKLFSSNSKFDSGTGWPSFSEALPGAFLTKVDYSFGMKRTEYHCAKCVAHHGLSLIQK